MSLPTREDFMPLDALDAQWAFDKFFGKDLDQAKKEFDQVSISCLEDLMFMGMGAFRYYVQAAISHIESDAATDEYDFIGGFAGVLELRLEYNRADIVPIAPVLQAACQYILDNFDKFALDPKDDSDLQRRYIALRDSFSEMRADSM